MPEIFYQMLGRKHIRNEEGRLESKIEIEMVESAWQVEYPEIEEGSKPRHRFMSAYEQKKEAWDKKYQYLLFAADPYEVIAFKVPNIEVERNEKFFSHWYARTKSSSRQL